MFLVLESFASKDYSGVKGQTIEIKDKKFAKSLIKGNIITEYNRQNQKNADKDKEIVELKTTISELTDKKAELEKEKAELLLKVQELEDAFENKENGTDGTTENHSENEDENKDTNKVSNNK